MIPGAIVWMFGVSLGTAASHVKRRSRSLLSKLNLNERARLYTVQPRTSNRRSGRPSLQRLVSNSLKQKRLDRCDILFEVSGKAVALLEVVRRIVAEPHFAVSVFPDERLQRQVNGGAGSGDHQWRATF